MNNSKIIAPGNLGVIEIRNIVDDFREANRNVGRSHPLTHVLGAYMLATAPEFRGGNDPRPALVPDETATYMRTLLERAGVDVDRSINIALARTGAVA